MAGVLATKHHVSLLAILAAAIIGGSIGSLVWRRYDSQSSGLGSAVSSFSASWPTA